MALEKICGRHAIREIGGSAIMVLGFVVCLCVYCGLVWSLSHVEYKKYEKMTLVGKSTRDSAELRNYSVSGPFELRNFHWNFIFPIVNVFLPIWNMFPPVWNPLPPLILPIS
jgi:hypothetical protein